MPATNSARPALHTPEAADLLHDRLTDILADRLSLAAGAVETAGVLQRLLEVSQGGAGR